MNELSPREWWLLHEGVSLGVVETVDTGSLSRLRARGWVDWRGHVTAAGRSARASVLQACRAARGVAGHRCAACEQEAVPS